MTQIRENGDRSAVYKALHQWSDALDTNLPPYGDLAFFISNGYMKQLAKVRDDRIGYVWFDYADGYVPRLDFETDQMAMYAEGGWEDENKADYEGVREFVVECIAIELMKQKMNG